MDVNAEKRGTELGMTPLTSLHSLSPIAVSPSPHMVAERVVAFLDNASTPQVQALLDYATPRAEQLIKNFRASPSYRPSPVLEQRLNEWFFSSDGQELARNVANTALEVLNRTVSHGHPGHDARHVLLMDPLSALRHCIQDNIFDYRSLFLIGALYHDIGRLCEPRLHGAPASGVRGKDHQYLGAALTEMLLAAFPGLPIEIRDSILFSILVHQTGSDSENLAAQIVQRADREQLVGPEFGLRAIPCNVGFRNLSFETPRGGERQRTLAIAGSGEEKDVANHIEFYLRNLYPNVGSRGAEEAERLKIQSAVFLALAVGPDGYETLFAPELARDRGTEVVVGPWKRPLNVETWEAIKRELATAQIAEFRAEAESSSHNPLETLLRYCEAPAAKSPRESRTNELDPRSKSVWEVVTQQFNALSSEEKRRWGAAFEYAIETRDVNVRAVMTSVAEGMTSVTASPVLAALWSSLSSSFERSGPSGDVQRYTQ